ncbi:diaminopimelate epimerase [Desulfofundulus sp. TPOSR]|uniref:Diaminopimelate epimerase n=1 Tax=Desulfofundulus kuznetsovii (strain DSM 6115 / VKM B-1805 / 17) TaxID=760568 RepID=A0AAU8PA72_DESK7|nr:diaminopimelate epimerase [Desulfofundulus sp. TPOSR]AEG14883.1 Diaminopimelate epimerase [Desulfofundulus kuznetsovii DSM 6115]NHM25649.1 diaminopimelate epimerase [Desulfofundulus sp. TPOSR]
MQFFKVHGLGNDFILVDLVKQEWPGGEDLSESARRLCHRQFGIGADGLVLLHSSPRADVFMQIINPDGSEAEMCGNAIRCVAKYLYERGGIKKEVMHIETRAGVMVPRLVLENGRVAAVRVDMGIPRLERQDIPMIGPPGQVINEPLVLEGQAFHVTAVSMGNPHCVLFVPDVERVDLHGLGPKLEKHPLFPRKTNVEFVQVLNRGEVRVRVWERGAGPTLACGTGACATVVAGVLNNYTDREVKVHLPGGTLLIEWKEDDHLYMTGPAEEVFCGQIPCP